jgi:flagellar basal-body rod protein FlgB
MMLDDIPLFSMLKGRLSYLNQRQQVIAQNVANSDTPGYTPNDLKPFTVASGADAGGGLVMASVSTNAAFIGGSAAGSGSASMTGSAGKAGGWKPQASPDSETRLDGNKVVLEEEMMKMQDARLNYETALGLYQKSLGLLQLAIKAPGKP